MKKLRSLSVVQRGKIIVVLGCVGTLCELTNLILFCTTDTLDYSPFDVIRTIAVIAFCLYLTILGYRMTQSKDD